MLPQRLHLQFCNSGMRLSDRKPVRLFVHGATPRLHSTLRLKIYSANEIPMGFPIFFTIS